MTRVPFASWVREVLVIDAPRKARDFAPEKWHHTKAGEEEVMDF
jgi:hypothetical protein